MCWTTSRNETWNAIGTSSLSAFLGSRGDVTCDCSISAGASLLYNNMFPKHATRLQTKVSELITTVGKQTIPDFRKHFDVVIACEDANGDDLDVPLVSIYFR